MTMKAPRRNSLSRLLALGAFLGLGATLPLSAQEPPRTVQPGAPGEAGRVVDASMLDVSRPPHSAADVVFMRQMIPHHAQALVMSELVPDRTASESVRLLALRIHMAQFDEIALMARWLHDRGEAVPAEAAVAWEAPEDPHAGHAMPGAHAAHAAHADHADHTDMPGMLTPEQLDALAAASGETFDRLFLQFMIHHHEGALTMVEELFASEAGGQENEIYQFAAHVDSDQRIEIARMQRMLAENR
jgi:uncharacterized protein (DUF305 family)